jgi:hypothetical protein
VFAGPGHHATAESRSLQAVHRAVAGKALSRGRLALVVLALAAAGCDGRRPGDLGACAELYAGSFREIADERTQRFQGKVTEQAARCRGGGKAVAYRGQPWMDWPNYWAAGGANTRTPGPDWLFGPNQRGIRGALLDFEYLRMELVKFNLFDNSGTYADYVRGRDGTDGPILEEWPQMRLPADSPDFPKMKVDGAGRQLCQGDLIRFRSLTGICNDIRNPLMGSTGQLFARNVQFDATFPDLGNNALARDRHGGRLGLLTPDPQMISRRLFTRAQTQPEQCRAGQGLPGFAVEAHCDYKAAPFLNVLAAFWIQFMTHDWFSHLREGRNRPELMRVGCTTQRVDGKDRPLAPADVTGLGCRPDDRMEKAQIASRGDPATFTHQGKTYLTRAYQTTRNTVTAWWDASQLYGYDDVSLRRVKRDPRDHAKLLLIPLSGRAAAGDLQGYLPTFAASDPIAPQWAGQEAAAFPDNWSVGMSFFHNVFAREHNLFVAAFRSRAAATPQADSGLRNPADPQRVIRYQDVSAEELFEVARLVVSAEIAKIHTIEWTTQLLYDEPLYQGMNANWHGLEAIGTRPRLASVIEEVASALRAAGDPKRANQLHSAFAAGSGIFGHGSRISAKGVLARFDPDSKDDVWTLANPDHVNGGVIHFGSPFNFPEEFVTVYRLHAMVPDLLEYRELRADPDLIVARIPVVATFRGKATQAMRERGLASWALSMGRQPLGALTLENHPQFLQNLPMPHLQTKTGVIDVPALDLIRDRERGVPRFNEFRRQYGLKQLTGFDDFVDRRNAPGSPERNEQERLASLLREVYGQHRCDQRKLITHAQVNDDKSPINDCLGHPDGSLVDNVEDLDTVVGWLAEPKARWPHGFAISETQFQVFILNASRRLFSDRFFTSSFRPEFYTTLGVEWVTHNGPGGPMPESGTPNGHEVEVSPLKRVLLRTIPELAPQLEHVVNVFDPWTRARGDYYSLEGTEGPVAR